MHVADWRGAFTEAFQHLQVTIQRGEATPIDAYAAKSPAEFFAVISEYFFELPAVVQAAYPAVYTQLKAFYRQDPLQRTSVKR